MNHGQAFLSPMLPNSGWITADAIFAANTSMATDVYE